ncbi:hypothetical protein [Vannielia litorea]|uniref:hypothetical protein n=1 Tax=Vannielia litorea TaxID=1217970 RepID=UPI001C93778D|nr:hypothetical protein [Vannielia litorea]MBY6046705.1 hypothetical protein [Vannielia litorea]MBY6074119.1 hypothetical protein [Vannielia litorea]
MDRENIILVEVKATYALTPDQARHAVQVATALYPRLSEHERSVPGVDRDGTPEWDHTDLLCDYPEVCRDLGVEMMEQVARKLDAEEAQKFLSRWPNTAFDASL